MGAPRHVSDQITSIFFHEHRPPLQPKIVYCLSNSTYFYKLL